MGFFKWAGLYIIEFASLIYYGEKNSADSEAVKSYGEETKQLKAMGDKLLNSQAAEEKNSNIYFFITLGILLVIVLKSIILVCFCIKRCVKKTVRNAINEP